MNQNPGERVFITVRSRTGRTASVQIGDEFIRAEILQERVRQKMEPRPIRASTCAATADVQLQDLMEVFGMLTAAGVTNVGIVNRFAAGTVGNVNDVTIKGRPREGHGGQEEKPGLSGLTLRGPRRPPW